MSILSIAKEKIGIWALGYDAAIKTRKRRDLPYGRTMGRDEDKYIGSTDRNMIRQKCLDMRRNDGLVAGIVTRFADNVVGSGIYPQAKTSSREWNDQAESYWYEWCKIADSRGRLNMSQMQRLAVQMRMLAGDMGFILTAGGQIQPIESERIVTPNDKKESDSLIVDGVEIDPATGRETKFYVFQRDGNGRVDPAGKYATISAYDMIFMANPFRFDQVRGIPDLASVVTSVQDIKEIGDATLQKAKTDAMRAWAIYSDNAGSIGNLGARGVDNEPGATNYEKFEDGMTYYLAPGEKAESLESKTPGSQYLPYMEYNLRLIGSALGIPYEFVLLDFSKGSYSSSRAALLQTYRTFTGWQEWLRDSFLQRVWNWKIAKAIKEKALPPPPKDKAGVSEWYKVEWQFPEFGWVDPQNESAANKQDYQMGITTLSALTRKKGRDVEDVFTEKAGEIALAQVKADDMNKSNPSLALTWRDIINVETVANQKAAESSSKPAGDNTNSEKPI
jgi:lambda family phage portal protein